MTRRSKILVSITCVLVVLVVAAFLLASGLDREFGQMEWRVQ